ncbi:MAG: hypothetical protein HY900_34765 [Deltaproteobacteria bacterium]|nr:hypothetical protein [Deltaproteobacteria bacterium]
MTALHEPCAGPALALAGALRRAALLGRTRKLVCAEIADTASPAVYVGEGESLPWLALVHGGQPRKICAFPLRGLSRLAAPPDNSLCVEVNRLLGPLLPTGGFGTLPWVRQVIDLESPCHRSRVPSLEGTFGRKVRKFGFRYDVAVDQKAVDEYYHGLYFPYVTWRFGALAHPRSLAQLRAATRRGFVLRVFQEEHWVAAAVCRRRRDTVTVVAFGLREPFEERLRQGALSAVYYWLLRWARDHRVRHVDLLRSRPHTRDGVYHHKSRFGAEAIFDPWPHAGLWFFPPGDAPLSAASVDFLVRGDGGGLVSLRQAWERAAQRARH